MNLSIWDWAILAALIVFLSVILWHCQKYIRSTAGFLAANRLAGRYLLTVSSGISWIGAISIIAAFEMSYSAGFSPVWWSFVSAVIGLISAASGWVTYRFRETRALTMPQFLETRYSRKFRIFAGILAWVSGVANYGIFPAVSVHFFMYFCGIPGEVMLGPVTIAVYPVLTFTVLAIGASFAIFGGQISIMVTDFFQGIFCGIVFVVIIIFLLLVFQQDTIIATLTSLSTQSKSLVNPFQSGSIRDFNPWFFVISIVAGFYNIGCWLGSQGFQVAARTPHENKMAALLGPWRGLSQNVMLLFIPICALVAMHNPAFAPLAENVKNTVNAVADPQLREQITVPIALLNMLPVGLLGLFVAVMFAAMLSTDNTYMHSWGAILVQDVIMPLRGKPFSPKNHLLMLRLSIVLVGVIAFAISNLYRQTQYIYLYCNITAAIFMGGAGSVVIGGLYWKRGSTLGAWLGMSAGSLLAVANIVLGEWLPSWFQNADGRPLINAQWGFAISILGAVGAYVMGSLYSRLVNREEPYLLDRMLHRGAFAVPGEEHVPKRGLAALGLTAEYKFWDKVIFFLSLGWTILWFVVSMVLALLEITGRMTTAGWAKFWYGYVVIGAIVGGVATIWIMVGGLRDLRQLFLDLKKSTVDNNDDGFVQKDGDTAR